MKGKQVSLKEMVFVVAVDGVVVLETTDYSKAWEETMAYGRLVTVPVTLTHK